MSSKFIHSIIVLVLCLLFESYSIVDRTYFRYLGLEITATTEQIEKAYRVKLDKINSQQSEQEKNRKLPLLEIAYKSLVNPEEREKYERYGKDYVKHNIKQITSFSQFAGYDKRKGSTMRLKIPVSTEDLYNGTTVKALFKTKQACHRCLGTGAENIKSLKTCGTCGGKGFSLADKNMYGQRYKSEELCPSCQGTGKIVTKICPICHGKKIHDTVKVIDIQIPEKFQQKQLKLKNYGPQQQLGAPSDFLLEIQEIPSKQWRRQGAELIYTMQISFQESIFGFKKILTHLSGEQIQVQRKELTSKKTKLYFESKGFNSNGRLTVQFEIKIPKFSDKQLDMWDQFFLKYRL